MAYIVATYAEALALRLYLLYEGATLDAILRPTAMLSFLLSPILLPRRYSIFLHVRSMKGFTFLVGFHFALFVTFVAAFLGVYLLIRSAQRRRRSGNMLHQD